jgi:ABC-type polysaccharide/polyol phosphate transport system ATPase subunit
MMDIINAKNIGIKFKLHRERRNTLKGTIARVFANERRRTQEFWALKGVSFSIKKGETLGVIGRNGSGKSTLLRVIGGIFTPDEGYLKVRGSTSTLLSITAGFQPELSGLDNIYLNGILLGFREQEINAVLSDIIEFSELNNFIETPVKTYSSGMYARLGFSIAINLKRDIMLIDEVLGVGDTKFRQKCEEKLKEVMREGRTIVLVSHNMEPIEKFADKVVWLDKGTVKASGATHEVIKKYLAT